MGQVLYRKYRPKSLNEVAGQEQVTETLKQALDKGRISHAYLFTGPRGTGKTSVARILAHEINKLAYTDDSQHLDIIEIDAASNRRIDEIRELREKVYVAPTSAKYKVYIIDEVHMLTREAFNALLKTLEEPPEHVVFILATTDAHKLPETIISRTQRYSFKPVPAAVIASQLEQIAKSEKLAITSDALQLLATHGDGSFRDSISLLDQASSSTKEVDETTVRRLLGLPTDEAIHRVLSNLASGASNAELLSNINGLYEQGFQASVIAKLLADLVRSQLVSDDPELDMDSSLRLLSKLLEVPASYSPERFLEISLLQLLPTPPTVLKVSAASSTSAKVLEKPKQIDEPDVKPPKEAKVVTSQAPKPEVGDAKLDDTLWPSVLQALKKRHNTLYGIVRMAQPHFNDNKLTLSFNFGFHQKRLNEPANQQLLASVIEELTGQKVTIECLLDPNAEPIKALPAVEAEPDEELSAISNIFNGAELLES